MRKNYAIDKWISDNTDKHLCECGCGQFVVPTYCRYFRSKSLRFVNFHQNRGQNHPNFKKGIVSAKGYIWHLVKSHPRRTPRGYVKRCWLVAEQKIRRFLQPDEVVHHKDLNKLNDHPDNLEVMDRVSHLKIHGFPRKTSSTPKAA